MAGRPRSSLVLSILLVGCALDRTGIGSAGDAGAQVDGARQDAGVRADSGVPIVLDGALDAASDADFASDGGDASTEPEDAGPPDAGPPDPAPPSCDSQYGTAESYLLCTQSPTECEFSVLLGGSTCRDLCSSLGGRCIRGYAGTEGSCSRDGDGSCEWERTDHVCVCSRGP